MSVYLVAHDALNPLIVNGAVDKALACAVVDVGEVVREIDLQDVAFRAVLAVVLDKLALHAPNRVVGAAPLDVRGAPLGEGRPDRGREGVTAQRLLYDALREVDGADVAQLAALEQVKLDEAAPEVSAREKVAPRPHDVWDDARHVALNARFPAHASGSAVGGIV